MCPWPLVTCLLLLLPGGICSSYGRMGFMGIIGLGRRRCERDIWKSTAATRRYHLHLPASVQPYSWGLGDLGIGKTSGALVCKAPTVKVGATPEPRRMAGIISVPLLSFRTPFTGQVGGKNTRVVQLLALPEHQKMNMCCLLDLFIISVLCASSDDVCKRRGALHAPGKLDAWRPIEVSGLCTRSSHIWRLLPSPSSLKHVGCGRVTTFFRPL